jgi:beta-mannosidase
MSPTADGAPAQAVTRQPLDTGWSVRCARAAATAPDTVTITAGSVALPATVPGCVHTDLLAAGLLPDPFVDTNEADVAWVAASDWAYTCRFTAGAELLAHDHVDLTFDGLDTLASITLNGTPIGGTANMHRRYRFPVRALVVEGDNVLDIELRSATEHADRLVATEGAWPSASFGRPFNHVRKMACSWGWDWGPWLSTAGVWRPAALVGWSAGRLGDVRPHITVSADDHGRVDLAVDVVTPVAPPDLSPDLHVRARLHDTRGAVVAEVTEAAHGAGTVWLAIDAHTVDRWWPHTHGAQPLYHLTVELLDTHVVDSTTQRIGFRTIELDTTPDATGSAFTLVVNGRPIFARGVNWIPDDIFPSRVSHADHRHRLRQAVGANVDLIRVWGGGIYEDDHFYATCDELGLLVWQDFLFACAAYPEHLLTDEVEAEAADNVSRLMHHASLAIWNGNNENIWGHWDWGWQDELQGRTWGAGFYHDLLPRVCATLDPGRAYWPGSPWSGSSHVAPNADSHGCVHVWDVWNQLDLIRYRDHTPRFVAEFGWQAPPSIVTMADHVSPEHFRRDSDAMRNHQKATDGDLKLDRGVILRFGVLDDLEAFWYAAQVVQARAIRVGVEHFRSLRPHCMGTIWWQLNDCWPVASWSVVDSAGRAKPSWYALRDACASQLVTLQPRGDRLALFAVNDVEAAWPVDVTVRRIALDGTEFARQDVTTIVDGSSTWSTLVDPAVAVPRDPTAEVVVVTDGAGSPLTWWWFAHDRELLLHDPALTVEHREVPGGVVLEITSPVVVRELAIYPERVRSGAGADRQLITLLPGVTERIAITGVTLADAPALDAPPARWSIADLVR